MRPTHLFARSGAVLTVTNLNGPSGRRCSPSFSMVTAMEHEETHDQTIAGVGSEFGKVMLVVQSSSEFPGNDE